MTTTNEIMIDELYNKALFIKNNAYDGLTNEEIAECVCIWAEDRFGLKSYNYYDKVLNYLNKGN